MAPLASLLTLALAGAYSGVSTGPTARLAKALAAPRAILPEIAHAPAHTSPSRFDLEDISTKVREAGAAALVLPAELLPVVAAEQASALSSYPGPLPLICQLVPAYAELHDEGSEKPLELAEIPLADLRKQGADGIMLRVSSMKGTEELSGLVEAAAVESLGTVLVAASAEEVEAVANVGAIAIICEGDAKLPTAADGDAPRAVEFGLWWDGDARSLAKMRDAGLERIFIEDACGGNIVHGVGRCVALIAKAQSKKSSQWSGSMFGVSDNLPPERRNPLAWSQSKRQAREIMHDSAASRGLPPPKLNK